MLVTGASGALGMATVDRLREMGEYDLFTTRRGALHEALNSFECDFSKPGDITKVLESVRPDCVLHLAATFGTDLAESLNINFGAAEEILKWVARCDKPVRVVLIGSAAEYGAIRAEENPIDELHVLAPVSVYGVTKACQSQLVSFYAARKVDVVLARIFNLSGENLSERLFVGRVHAQIRELKDGQRTHIEVGALSATRDYLPLPAAVQQLLAILHFGIAGHAYHVASGVPTTMRALLDTELNTHGLNSDVVRESPALSNRTGFDVPVIYASLAKTQKLMELATYG